MVAVFRAHSLLLASTLTLTACERSDPTVPPVNSASTHLVALSHHLETCKSLKQESPVPVQAIIDFESYFESFAEPIVIEPGTPTEMISAVEKARLAFAVCMIELKARI